MATQPALEGNPATRQPGPTSADFVIFNDFRVPLPPALCGCVAAPCGASAPSNKNTPLDVWSVHLVDFVMFNDFRVQQMQRSVGATRNEG